MPLPCHIESRLDENLGSAAGSSGRRPTRVVTVVSSLEGKRRHCEVRIPPAEWAYYSYYNEQGPERVRTGSHAGLNLVSVIRLLR